MKNNKALKILFTVFLSIFSAILVLGIVFVSVFGFNKSADLSGGEKITISAVNAGLIDGEEYKNEFVSKQSEIIAKSKKVLNSFGKVNVTEEILGEEQDQSIVLIYKDDKNLHKDDIDVQNAKIVAGIKNEIASVSALELSVSDAQSVTSGAFISWGIEAIAVCVLILCAFTYFMIRFFTSGAIAVLIGIVTSGFAYLAVIAFSRIEVTKFLICGVLISLALVAISQVIVLNNAKKLYVNGNKSSSETLIPEAVKLSLWPVILLGVIVFLVGVGFCFISLSFGLYLIISAVVSTLVNLFIIPGFLIVFAGKSGLKIKFNNFNK